MNTGASAPQLNLVDIRPCQAERESTQVQREVYLRHRRCKPITADEAESLLPRRPDFTAVWRYLISHQDKGPGAGRFCVPVPQDPAPHRRRLLHEAASASAWTSLTKWA